ncbi:MAG: sel1 repeat family protein [Gemmataceae bacterium]|nr:sel1 repeat family protein [Gemmataceae bacterium]
MPSIADAVAAYERHDFAAARSLAAALLPSNHTQAHYLLGLMHSYGEGGPADPASAASHFRAAADAGHPGAMFNLAALFAQGRGVPQSFAEARAWYARAAEAGNPDGLYQLGVMHQHGQGVPADLDAAAAHWERAASAGQPRAMTALGRLYADGGPGRSVDPGLAAYWFFQAWQAGEDEAEHDIIHVRDALEAAADGGSASAQLALGLVLCFGHDDPAAAAPWFDLAAAQDHPEGVRMLAYLYETGKGVPPDAGRADALYRRAAELGDPLALTRLRRE